MPPEHQPAFGDPVGPWHWWLAWFPVRTWDGRLSWLRYLKRRRIQKCSHLSDGPLSWWEYEREDGYVT